MSTEKRLKKRSAANSLKYEKSLWALGESHIAGIDEAGRGCLAGPVVAACVIMPPEPFFDEIDDSKALSEKVREELFFKIKNAAVDYCISIVDSDVIDEINILNSAKKAFIYAADGLKIKPYCILTDAMPLSKKYDYIELIKGDARAYNIAAASILAKCTRDAIMRAYSEIYPKYNFARHKGYATKEHVNNISKYGVCPIHRRTFLRKILS